MMRVHKSPTPCLGPFMWLCFLSFSRHPLAISSHKPNPRPPTGATLNLANNHLQSLPSLATINQICLGQRGRNSNLCKPCLCNLEGAASTHCDTYTRRCSCLPGYSGDTCNKCSEGYYNATQSHPQSEKYSSNSLHTDPHNSLVSRAGCLECDGCFHRWRQNVTELKEQAVHSIERASKLDQAFNDRIGIVVNPIEQTPRLKLDGERTSLVDLESSIRIIGERVLGTKQKSDQINLLDAELNSTVTSIELGSFGLENQKDQLAKLESKWNSLSHDAGAQSYVVRDLSASIKNLEREVLIIRETLPCEALELVKGSRNRTQKALSETLEIDSAYSGALNATINELTLKLARISFSAKQLDLFGARILTDSIRRHLPDHSMNETARIPADDVLDSDLFHESVSVLHKTARSIVGFSAARFDEYQDGYEIRSLDVAATRRHIGEAESIMLSAGRRLSAVDRNLTALQSPESNSMTILSDGHRFDHMAEGAILSVRSKLDKIDIRWNSSQSDLTELSSKMKDSEQTMIDLSAKINQVVDGNLPALLRFKESIPEENLSDSMDMKERTKFLLENLVKLSRNLTNLKQLKQTTLELDEKTKRLNGNIKTDIEETNRWLFHPEGAKFANGRFASDNRTDSSNTSSFHDPTSEALMLASRSYLDKIRAHQSEAFGRKMLLSQLIEDKISELRNTTSTNERLATEVEDKLTMLTECLETMTTAKATNTSHPSSDRATKLSERKRLQSVIGNLRQVSVLIYKDLARTDGLAEEFVVNERVFEDQRKTIVSLHNQMDEIIVDLERGYDKNCTAA